MPDRHRGAALRLAWARHQLAEGRQVWTTPAIHTWEAWLTRQWRDAVQRGAASSAQLLNPSQERALWEQVLGTLAREADVDEAMYTQHAGALMQAAARATQDLIPLDRAGFSQEETLLSQALARVHRECAARGLLSLRLATPASLAFLQEVRAPLVTGERTLTALQSALVQRCWTGTGVLHAPVEPEPRAPRLIRAGDLEQEIAACASWCRQWLERDAGARLLVLSACIEPSLQIQSALLWRELAGGDAEDALRARWLVVEGGQPLMHQALFADALGALDLASAGEIDTAQLLALLRSAYVHFGDGTASAALITWFGHMGLGRWSRAGLREAMAGAAAKQPAAGSLADWLALADEQLPARDALAAGEWARRFTVLMEAAGFGRPGQMDSREAQRLARWNELLDEFAGLDAVLPPMRRGVALAQLRRLATRARHQAATSDAAITLSATLGDPVVDYDGIWVLGMTETRWPGAPRPDPWVPLPDQRRAGWPESGATQRREHAGWALQSWQLRAGELVLSYAEREGDLAHRPAPVMAEATWEVSAAEPASPVTGLGHAATDQQFAPLSAAERLTPLRGGTGRLTAQQACAFRAQAQWRLHAEPPETLSVGVPLSLRGRLLHLLLQHLWQALGDQAGLLAIDAATLSALLDRCWSAAVAATPAARWIPAQSIERERLRTRRLIDGLLELERSRAPFAVEQREFPALWTGAGASLALRIDRIDRVAGEALLIDYKSGAPARIQLHEGAVQPLQLAVYAAALAQQGVPVSAAALLNLHPSEPEFAGVTARADLMPDLRLVEDWAQARQQWDAGLEALMRQHVAGDGTLARDRQVCTRCHLPALCRRAGADVAEAADE